MNTCSTTFFAKSASFPFQRQENKFVGWTERLKRREIEDFGARPCLLFQQGRLLLWS